ncbi:MAG: O-succinylhomoserine sulfhydrylase [Gammaproteobacteria bacterium]|nr:O-succinylhomoserine sulfhydrylase [Gammaproteobacteria bacterium]
MAKIDPARYGVNTLAVRAGRQPTAEGEHSEPLFLTSSYVFKDAAQAAARFAEDEPGNIYSRFTNSTVRVFEERLAAMEQAERCIATASGMGAILSACLGLLQSGDHIVSSRSVFGTTVNLFNKVLSKFSIATSYVSLSDYDAWAAAITDKTRLLYLETPSNPLTEIADIQRLADLARRRGCLLVVDNCFCTPALQQPLLLGADIVIHSATKYLDGQGRCIGGAVLGREELLGENVYHILKYGGPTMSPFNAWVFLKGLETLGLRMTAHSRSAAQIADWLNGRAGIAKVYYPGLADHPQHELAQRQQQDFGGIVSFVVNGGKDAAWRLIDNTELFSITANLGDSKSTITHPATTTHNRLTDEEKQKSGIAPGLVRLSIGHEDVADLKDDLETALTATSKN